MTIFEYVMVLVSIIIGLGIARMLDGVLRILRSGRPYRTYWVHSVWVALTFFEMVWHWAYRWFLQERADWTVFELLFFLLPTILLFLAAGLLFPEREASDMRSYYFQRRRPFFAVFVAVMVVYSIETWWIFGMGLGNRGDLIRLSIVGLCISLMISQRSRVHAILTVAAFLVILGVRLPVFGGTGGRFASPAGPGHQASPGAVTASELPAGGGTLCGGGEIVAPDNRLFLRSTPGPTGPAACGAHS